MTTLTVARNAFLESIRQPVFVVIILSGMLAVVLNVNLAAFTFEDDTKILIDLGLSSLFVCGLLLAAFTATSVLSREIENRTVLTVVSKPVPRPVVVIGKYLGVAAALVIGYGTLAGMFLLSVRHRVGGASGGDGPVIAFGIGAVGVAVLLAAAVNYLHGRPFTSSFVLAQAILAAVAVAAVWCVDPTWRLQNPLGEWNSQLMLALLLVGEAVLVLAAVAIATSVRVGQVMTLVICSGLFLGGLVSEYFLGTVVADPDAGWWRWLAWPAYAVVPNLQFFWAADALTQGRDIGTAHVAAVSLYAACLIAAFLSLGVLLFQQRDVG